MAAYDAAVAELYQSPLATFVAERKRLAAALKAEDKAGAAKLAKLARPTISAWVVDQLWWHAREAFDALLATAARLRAGELDATAAHREAIATLRARAASFLGDAGHAATESTLRRVTMTLAAIAAAGGFDPDPPGALAEDRDPPGFEALGGVPIATAPAPGRVAATSAPAAAREDTEARARAEAEAAASHRKQEEARARRTADRHRVTAALATARGEVASRERERERLVKQLAEVERSIEHAKAAAEDLEVTLETLAD